MALQDVTAGLARELDGLCAVDPASVADGETLVQLHRQLARLAAVVTRATAAFDTGRQWEVEGARPRQRGLPPVVACRSGRRGDGSISVGHCGRCPLPKRHGWTAK